jgi:hypothetical protein
VDLDGFRTLRNAIRARRPGLTEEQADAMTLEEATSALAMKNAVPTEHTANVLPNGTSASGIPERPGLELIPGGFSYRGISHDLTGQPWTILKAILESRHRRLTADALREVLDDNEDDEDADHDQPEQLVKGSTCALRAALKKAAKEAGEDCENPLRSTGRGRFLAYSLSLP